jgi:hypothetical protein
MMDCEELALQSWENEGGALPHPPVPEVPQINLAPTPYERFISPINQESARTVIQQSEAS